MDGDAHRQQVTADQTPAKTDTTTTDAATAARRLAALRQRQHEDEELDEALLESFPASDPPSSWAGP
jgi:hypothetical protein